jgi:hypothetical protein
MSDSSRHALFAIPEVTYGTTPATPAFQTMRHTGTTLGLSKGTLMSEEIRADRQLVDFRHGAKQTGGDISGEMSYGTYDLFLQAVLLGTWAVKATKTAITLSAAAADDSFNDSGNGFITAGFEVGDRITVSGFTGDVANNASYLISTVAAGKIVVTKVDGTAATNIVDDAAGEAVTIATAAFRLKAGVERRSFSVMRHFTDQVEADEPFHLFKGVELNTLNMTITTEAIVTAVFGCVGKGLVIDGEAPAASTYVAANDNSVMDSFNGSLKEGAVTIGIVSELTLTLENGITPRFVVGSDETIKPSILKSNLTGQVTVYFENAAMMQKFVNQTVSSIDCTLRDEAGNSVRILIPRLKYTGGQPDTQGDGPVMLTMPFQAVRDPVTGSNICIDRLAAA